MQVLLVLVGASGSVVSREDLHRICWGGVVVGEDSINRAVAEIRRIIRLTGAGFTLETIPRVGYRIVGETAPLAAGPQPVQTPQVAAVKNSPFTNGESGRFTRRHLLAGGAAGACAVGAAAFLHLRGTATQDGAEALLDNGNRLLREAWPGTELQATRIFGELVRRDPDNAAAWGLLAVAWRNVAEAGPPAITSDAVGRCEAAARAALSRKPGEGNALAALATLRPYFGDWGAAEDRMRKALAIAPGNPTLMTHLVTLLQSVGRARASWNLNEQALAAEPLSPPGQFRKALKYWIFGNIPQADLTIDRALQLWPRHPAVWNTRLYLFAFTGRAEAALKFIGTPETRPGSFSRETDRHWRPSLVALRSPTPSNVAVARKAIFEAAPDGFAVSGMMILSALGDLDAAYAVADGFLLRQGPLVGSLWPATGQMSVNDQQWRRTMNLFTPASAAMRSDPRFASLCEGIGLGDYWRGRSVGPDGFLKVNWP